MSIDHSQQNASGMTATEIRELVRTEINANRSLASSDRFHVWIAVGKTIATVLATVILIIMFTQSQIGRIQSEIVNVQLRITELKKNIQNLSITINASIDGVRSVRTKNTRNVGVKIHAHSDDVLPFSLRLSSIESTLTVLLPATSRGIGSILTAQELSNSAAHDGPLRAWPLPEVLP